MLEEGLVNILVVGFGESDREASEIRILLARIDESEVIVILSFIMLEIAIALAERPARGDLTGEVCHFNVKLYEKLLSSIFDVQDEGKPTEILQDVETVSNATDEHPLALLGDETKKHLKNDATVFMPVLSQWHPQAVAVSASLLHKLYGSKLIETISGTLRWEPVQQRHGSSIIEVHRNVEETVDQFFALKIPMKSGEMISLFRGIDNAFQDGLFRVLLDGGPLRLLMPSDAKFLEEDLLPRGVVENLVARVRQVIKLQGYELIDDLKSASASDRT
ncbi:hypothetical protein L1887_05314 [Cichorium endivia]|nr:hypothetical protein L1887_05314 [Cichorium endivia]